MILAGLLALPSANAAAENDLFSRKKSDAAIKPLVFPLSMVVVENRPLKGHYYFYRGEEKRFDDGLQGDPVSGTGDFEHSFSDRATIRKTLVATDRARISPSEAGEDVRGPVTREVLQQLSKKYSRDLILVFRREIRLPVENPFPESVFLQPDQLITKEGTGPYSLRIRSSALVYLAKQNKVLMVPANEKTKTFFSKEETRTAETVKADLRQMVRDGLDELTTSARKVIRDKQFVIRRPSY